MAQRAGGNAGGGGAAAAGARSAGYPSIDGSDDLARRVAESLRNVESSAFLMNRAIDQAKLDEAIEAAVKMLRELRVSSFSPRTYYELWMKVFDHLRQLKAFFLEVNATKDVRMDYLYERVQSTAQIIPRLYLMITVGSAFSEVEPELTKDVLQDLIDMVKGVQHPLRGLFLRNYLLKMTQDKLVKEFKSTTDFCISYILQNFGEMNSLWVRMQHQGNANNRARREKERRDLKVLISFNLVRLSELEDMSLEVYRAQVLDRLLDHITSCNDVIAQQYLLDVIVQVFPAAYHVETMPKVFESFELLQPGVDLKTILIGLMDRLKYSAEEEEDEDENGDAGAAASGTSPLLGTEVFEAINKCVSNTVAKREGASVEDTLDLQVALLDFAVACYPGQLEYIDKVLGFCASYLAEVAEEAAQQANVVDILVVQLLKVPLKQRDLGSVALLGLDQFPALMNRLSPPSQKKVAFNFLQHVLAEPSLLFDNVEVLSKLLEFISPLIHDNGQAPTKEELAQPGFADQQNAVAKLIHRITSEDTATFFKVLGVARKHFSLGGAQRIRFTIVPLCFRHLVLADRIRVASSKDRGSTGGEPDADEGDEEDTVAALLRRQQGAGGVSLRKVFHVVHELATTLAGEQASQDMALRVFLQAAQVADRSGEQEVAYEFMVQAFTLYEDIADTKEQLRTLPLLIGAARQLTSFDKDNYETVATKTMQYAVRLLKKSDQCKMLVKCSNLFWSARPKPTQSEDAATPAPGQDSKRAIECLQRSLKIADGSMAAGSNSLLFVDILDQYIYFFVAGMDRVTLQNINDLIMLIRSNIADSVDADEAKATEAALAVSVRHLDAVKAANPDDVRFAAEES